MHNVDDGVILSIWDQETLLHVDDMGAVMGKPEIAQSLLTICRRLQALELTREEQAVLAGLVLMTTGLCYDITWRLTECFFTELCIQIMYEELCI